MKKEYNKEDWNEFRKEVLKLIILYNHIKEFSNFDKNKIKYIESFFYFSKENAISSFFIKFGFLLSNGKPTFKNFLDDNDYKELNKLYKENLIFIRNKIYAHNDKNGLPDNLKNNYSKIISFDVDNLYNKIISFAKEIDIKHNEIYNYDIIINSNGIISLESYLDNNIELLKIKERLMNSNNVHNIKLDIITGKIILD